jgi:hypothetical protein
MTEDESLIALGLSSKCVGIVCLPEDLPEFFQGPPKAEAVSIMAYFGENRVAVHVEKMPLRRDWRARAIQNLKHAKEGV